MTHAAAHRGAMKDDAARIHREAPPSPDHIQATGRQRNPASPGAVATARWRRRKAKGAIVVPVELFADEVEALTRFGFLRRADVKNRRRIGRAVADLVERVVARSR